MSVVGHAGRYDEIAIRALMEAQAKGLVMIVIDGKHGFGLSVSALPESAVAVNMSLPELLRRVADCIEQRAVPDGIRVTRL